MERFTNTTTEGNELAIRRGVRVPNDAVNLAWVKAPALSPEKNIVIIDTSGVVDENTNDNTYTHKIFYANHLGILEDEHHNQLIEDEYPAISDTFSIDEDFLITPGSEYKAEHILPYLHTSRYFHVDAPGLTTGLLLEHLGVRLLRW